MTPEADLQLPSQPTLPIWIYHLAAVYLVLIGVFGIISNVSLVVVFVKNRVLQTPLNVLLINLILAELVISVYGIPIDFWAALSQGWSIGTTMCTTTGFILTLAGMVSIYTLSALSVQRWALVTQHSSFNFNSHQGTSLALILIWIMSLAMSMPPLLGWASFVPESSGLSCAPSWESTENFGYNVYLITLGFFLPLAIILYTSASVIYNMKENMAQMQSLNVRKSAQKRDNKVNLMILVMLISFLLCWSPYAIMSAYQIFGGTVTPLGSAFPVLFCKSSICLNPIIYVGMNSQFRNAITPGFLARKKRSGLHSTLQAPQKAASTRRGGRRGRSQVRVSGDHEQHQLTELQQNAATISNIVTSVATTTIHGYYPDDVKLSTTLTDHQVSSVLLGEVEDVNDAVCKAAEVTVEVNPDDSLE